MSDSARPPASVTAPAVAPLAGSHASALDVPLEVVLDAVTRAAAGQSAHDVALAALVPLCELDGVRAGAVVAAAGPGRGVRSIASIGYACATFDPGATLPADAGLPVTEAARTRRPVARGAGPGWVAVPVPDGGALLLSLTCAPPVGADLTRLERLGRALAGALRRAGDHDAASAELATLTAGLTCSPPDASVDLDVAVRSVPYSGDLTGDVADVVRVGAGVWILVADVSGRGVAAAVTADRVRTAFRALVLSDLGSGPGDVLRAVDLAVACAGEEFVTALVVHVRESCLSAASAGHPAPLVVRDGHVAEVQLRPGPPIGLGLGDVAGGGDVEADLPAGSVLVAYTDGLVDRDVEVPIGSVLGAVRDAGSADQLATGVVAACDAAGRSDDDVTLVVLRAGT